MDVGEAMNVAGIGCRKGAPDDMIEAAIKAALTDAGIEHVDAIAVARVKENESAIARVAARLGLPLLIIETEALACAADRTLTRSARVEALFGIPSMAEAAALASIGPSARLLRPRTAVGHATCAIATDEERA
jgi:cobalt-precorrin 5A hydrolase